MVQGYLVVAQQQTLAAELHAKVGDDFQLIPLQSVAHLADAPDERVAAVVIRMPPGAAVDAAPEQPLEMTSSASTLTLEAQVDELERRVIGDSLARNNQRRKETAIELGISRVTLYNKMKKFGML